MAFILMELPYSLDTLDPVISKETLEYHYGKHHQGYVNKLNTAIKDNPKLEKLSLEKLIKTQFGDIFNNAAQIWNHNFYWQCLTPTGTGEPNGKLAKAIDKNFSSFKTFQQEFTQKALSNFGSGWTWLVENQDNSLEIINTGNAGNPMIDGKKSLLTCDVWEHAYYIDYRNDRGKYVENFWKLVNWNFIEDNFNSL